MLQWNKISSRKIGIEFDDIHLGPGINVLVGSNGVGKSTIMNYISSGSKNVYVQGVVKFQEEEIEKYLGSVKHFNAGWHNSYSNIKFDPIKWTMIRSNSGTSRKDMPVHDTEYSCFMSEGKMLIFSEKQNWYVELKAGNGVNSILNRDTDLSSSFSETLQIICEETWNDLCVQEKMSTVKKKKEMISKGSDILEKFNKLVQKKTSNITSAFTRDIKTLKVKTDKILNQFMEVKEELKIKEDFKIIGKSNKELDYNELSSGQKAELNLFSFMQIAGFSMLDEPELSLSYNKVSMLTNRLKKSYGQKLISTHSTILLESLRFDQEAKIIRVYTDGSITKNKPIDIKDIQHIIKDNIFKNTSFTSMFRSLFSDHILLVEGVNDINVIFSNEEIYDLLRINNIEIWPMNGKTKVNEHVELMKLIDISYSILLDKDAVDQKLPYSNITYLGSSENKKIEGYLDIENYPELKGKKTNSKEVTNLLNSGIWPFKEELKKIVIQIINEIINNKRH